MMKNVSLLLSVAGFGLLNGANAFVPKATVGMGRVSAPLAPSTTAIGAIDAAMISEMETARTAFVLCLAGALGTAAVGREGEFESIRSGETSENEDEWAFRRNFSLVAYVFCFRQFQPFPSRSGNGRK